MKEHLCCSQGTTKAHGCCSPHRCIQTTDISKITKILVIVTIFMIIELWGHVHSHSLSLLADALHLLVDISGLLVSVVTMSISKRQRDKKMPFGYGRIEILGALLSILLIWAAVIYLMIESVHRYFHPSEILGGTFLKIAIIGLIVNIGCLIILHYDDYRHDLTHQNLNIRATYVHVLGDIVQSIGVIIASAVIFIWPSMVIADIFCTVLFAVLVLFSTCYILKDAIRILSEGSPTDIDQDSIKAVILQQTKINRILDLYIWSISVNKHCAMIKVLTDVKTIEEYENLMKTLREEISKQWTFEIWCIEMDTGGTCLEPVGFTIGGLTTTCKGIESNRSLESIESNGSHHGCLEGNGSGNMESSDNGSRNCENACGCSISGGNNKSCDGGNCGSCNGNCNGNYKCSATNENVFKAWEKIAARGIITWERTSPDASSSDNGTKASNGPNEKGQFCCKRILNEEL